MWISKKEYEKLIKSQFHDEMLSDMEKYFNMLVAKCQKLNSEKQELEAEVERLKKQLDGKNLCKLGSEIKCKWDDKIKDPDNEGKTITEKEYLKRILGYDCLEKFPFVAIHCVSENKDKEEENEIEIKPTYFTENEKHQCFDLCKIMNNGTKIGSRSCQLCNNNNGYDIKENWVKCDKIPEGKPKKEPKQPERFKRDEFGVISVSKHPVVCLSCIYEEQDVNSIECLHCNNNNKINEYYSSK